MNTDCRESNPHRRAVEATVPALTAYRIRGNALQQFVARLLQSSESFSIWLKRDRHRRALDRLSDHTLRDIGLVRVDIDYGWHRLL
jgi:uncharacterized protein YjiS (DUF1127 family)